MFDPYCDTCDDTVKTYADQIHLDGGPLNVHRCQECHNVVAKGR